MSQINPINKKIFQNEPIQFLKAAWPDIYLWDKLVEVCNSVAKNKRTAVPAGHGVGKTFIEARLALWFLCCFYPAKVITTAPTWPQVEKLLWAEITKAYNTSQFPLGGRLLQTELKIDEEWFAIGFSTRGRASEREYGTPKFQGYHSENLLVLLDEAPGIEHEIYISLEGLIVGENNKILAGGNPTSPSGDFYEACKSPIWHKINISSLDHPNVKEGRTVIPGAVTREWVEEKRIAWTETSPLWKAKVLGHFPDEGTDTLIPLSWAEACVNLVFPPTMDDKGNELQDSRKLGIDVARYGDDQTAIAEIEGKVVLPIETAHKKDTNWTIGRAKARNAARHYDVIAVDDTGVGGGVTDGLEDGGIDVDPINNGASAIDDETFENRGTEIWWNLREAIRTKDISLPDDKELINQLCSRKYKYTRRGRIILESKDEMKKRGLKSPDRADAVALAYSAGGEEKHAPSVTVISVDADDDL